MSTDDPDADDLPPAVRETLDSLGGALGDIAELDKEQLSETIGLLETLGHDQAAGILHSRREVLKGAGAATGLGIAGLAGASATGTASAGNDQAGTVGSQAAPLDGYVEDLYDKNGNRVAELPGDGSLDVLQELSSQSVSTDDAQHGTYDNIRVVGNYGDGTLADALSNIPTRSFDGPRSLRGAYVPPKDGYYDGGVKVDTRHFQMWGLGQSSEVQDNPSDHIIQVRENDCFISDLAVDHTGTGNYDAVKVDASKISSGGDNDECQLFRVSVDEAPRYGINVEAKSSQLIGCESTGGDVAAIRIKGNHIQAVGTKLQSPVSNGFLVADGAFHKVDAVIESPSGYGCRVESAAGYGKFDLVIDGPATNGIELDGGTAHNDVDATVFDATDDALWADNATDNTIHINTNGSVMLTSNSSNNTVSGRAGSLTDNGTSNDTSDLIT